MTELRTTIAGTDSTSVVYIPYVTDITSVDLIDESSGVKYSYTASTVSIKAFYSRFEILDSDIINDYLTDSNNGNTPIEKAFRLVVKDSTGGIIFQDRGVWTTETGDYSEIVYGFTEEVSFNNDFETI